MSFAWANEALNLVEAHDDSPHGGIMPSRTHSGHGSPFAFQGQKYDPEVNHTVFNLRQYDSRLGRWLTTDLSDNYGTEQASTTRRSNLQMGNKALPTTDRSPGSPAGCARLSPG